MRHEPNLRIEQYRKCHPVLGWSNPGENWGYFEIPFRGALLRVIASDGKPCEGEPEAEGWEHVSVSVATRCPTWEEMSHVKELFWADDECVVQFHPPKAEHINYMPYCLHLWRHVERKFTLPPSILVGPAQPEAVAP
jgi:hypothetical protein